MANWFPLRLKAMARSWLTNLPEGSISLWPALYDLFITKFRGTDEFPLTYRDLRQMRQKPGETLYKYLQRFEQCRSKIPRISDAKVISAFAEGVTDNKVLDKIGYHGENLSSVAVLFTTADQCAKAEAGRLFTHSEDSFAPRAKVLARARSKVIVTCVAKARQRRPHRENTKGESNYHPLCIFHQMLGHDTDQCFKLKMIRLEYDDRRKRKHHGERGSAPSEHPGKGKEGSRRAKAAKLRRDGKEERPDPEDTGGARGS